MVKLKCPRCGGVNNTTPATYSKLLKEDKDVICIVCNKKSPICLFNKENEPFINPSEGTQVEDPTYLTPPQSPVTPVPDIVIPDPISTVPITPEPITPEPIPHQNDNQPSKEHVEGHDEFISSLHLDANSYAASEIQQMVQSKKVSWDEIENIYGAEKTWAIRNYHGFTQLPGGTPPEQLVSGSTEVYFWGTPNSGKTCALGSIISSVKRKGMLIPIQCSGSYYMDLLSNIFGQNNICTFPDSTSIGSIQEMMMKLRDSNRKQHSLTLIDLAGELFRLVYFKTHNMFLNEEDQKVIDMAMSYLTNRNNKKIHFFVVEYGAHERTWDELRMENYLTNMMTYLRDQKVFRKSTVGVYILVTKCDKIPCSRQERPQQAFKYVCEELPSFWETLRDICDQSGVGDLGVLSYSVGEVFAQKLCKFDPTDTEKVIKRLIEKTRAEGGFMDKLRQ